MDLEDIADSEAVKETQRMLKDFGRKQFYSEVQELNQGFIEVVSALLERAYDACHENGHLDEGSFREMLQSIDRHLVNGSPDYDYLRFNDGARKGHGRSGLMFYAVATKNTDIMDALSRAEYPAMSDITKQSIRCHK